VRRLLVATTNAGKQAEFRRLLADLPAEIVTPDDVGLGLEVDEPYDTYAENATAKADAYARASGLLALADDSGIEVDALGGAPGVRTARWGGADRLLEVLRGRDDRAARMVCVVALGIPHEQGVDVETFSGEIIGSVATDRRGAGGFGYDPVFLTSGGRTTAELPDAEKDAISHRGRALQAARPRLLELLAEP
jgi:XTP/dITP diphosphohydrolase